MNEETCNLQVSSHVPEVESTPEWDSDGLFFDFDCVDDSDSERASNFLLKASLGAPGSDFLR
jgi:hypothetical protein